MKKNVKSGKCVVVFSEKQKKMSACMAKGEQTVKFETHPRIRYRDNYNTDGRTTEKKYNFVSSVDIVKQS